MTTVCFSHGQESGPWGTKIQALGEVARAVGHAVESLDYQGMDDPQARARKLIAWCRTSVGFVGCSDCSWTNSGLCPAKGDSMHRLLVALATVLTVTACGGAVDPPKPAADEDESSNVIGVALQRSLDKAHAVEDLSSGRKNELDDAIDAGSSQPE